MAMNETGNKEYIQTTLDKLIKLIATGFYTGFVPVAPGTAASILALIIYLLLPENHALYWMILIVLIIGGTIVSGEAEKMFKEKDSSCIVIDEICGYMLTMAFLPKNLHLAIIGFFLFRTLDIIKPSFVKEVEKLQGGIGIMLDDIVSGMICSLVLHIVHWI